PWLEYGPEAGASATEGGDTADAPPDAEKPRAEGPETGKPVAEPPTEVKPAKPPPEEPPPPDATKGSGEPAEDAAAAREAATGARSRLPKLFSRDAPPEPEPASTGERDAPSEVLAGS